MDCIYLHGFASGPKSEKAVYFSRRLRESKVNVLVPDLNQPSFEHMTLSSQLQIVEGLLSGKKERDVILFGSSMGGLLSAMLADLHTCIGALVLLAPGFALERRWQSIWGEDALQRWRADGFLDVYHYAYEKNMKLSVTFLDDALSHKTDEIRVSVPTFVVHGEHDDVVPVEESRKFAQLNPATVELKVVNDDHFLQADLDGTWQMISKHLAL